MLKGRVLTPLVTLLAGLLCLAASACKKPDASGSEGATGSASSPGSPGAGPKIRIGVLTDMSSLYADLAGKGSLIAAQMAVEDFGGKAAGRPVEVISSDHQNKADIGSNIARQWLDVEKVDVVVDVPNSSVALAVNEIVKGKNKVFLASGPATTDLTGKSCTPNTIHWTYDTWELANGTGKEAVKAGNDTWFFITADYAFGHSLERDVTGVVLSAGGKVVGGVRHPLNAPDFSSFLLQAQQSKAKIVGLANAGGDTINTIKQAAEFGIVKGGQKLAGLLINISDIHALGLEAAQGLLLTDAFYWDDDTETRAFSKRFGERHKDRMPSQIQAGVYSAVLHYLKAVDALKGAEDGAAVVAKMKELPTDDPIFGKGAIRADGRKIHAVGLYQVKAPSESKGPWDYYTRLREIPAEEAFRPLAESECPLVKK